MNVLYNITKTFQQFSITKSSNSDNSLFQFYESSPCNRFNHFNMQFLFKLLNFSHAPLSKDILANNGTKLKSSKQNVTYPSVKTKCDIFHCKNKM